LVERPVLVVVALVDLVHGAVEQCLPGRPVPAGERGVRRCAEQTGGDGLVVTVEQLDSVLPEPEGVDGWAGA
jgi:hypothetical protein